MTSLRERLNAPVWGPNASSAAFALDGTVQALPLDSANYLVVHNDGANTCVVTSDVGGAGGIVLDPGERFGAALDPDTNTIVYAQGTAAQTLRLLRFKD